MADDASPPNTSQAARMVVQTPRQMKCCIVISPHPNPFPDNGIKPMAWLAIPRTGESLNERKQPRLCGSGLDHPAQFQLPENCSVFKANLTSTVSSALRCFVALLLLTSATAAMAQDENIILGNGTSLTINEYLIETDPDGLKTVVVRAVPNFDPEPYGEVPSDDY